MSHKKGIRSGTAAAFPGADVNWLTVTLQGRIICSSLLFLKAALDMPRMCRNRIFCHGASVTQHVQDILFVITEKGYKNS